MQIVYESRHLKKKIIYIKIHTHTHTHTLIYIYIYIYIYMHICKQFDLHLLFCVLFLIHAASKTDYILCTMLVMEDARQSQ